MCELLEFAFNPSSAKTTCVSSAREALKWLENERPDLMVLDIAMPEKHGYSFLSKARARGITAPAITLTAYARPEDRVMALSAGFQLHIAKPVDPAQLVTAAASLCANRSG